MFNGNIQIENTSWTPLLLKEYKNYYICTTQLYKHTIFYFQIFAAQVWCKKVNEQFFFEHNKTTLWNLR